MTLSVNRFAPATVFEEEAFRDHEQVLFCHDRKTGLTAIIALHDTTLGPAMGGTRMWPYECAHHALVDVLRLSTGMTYKNALAGLPFGGGKAVIIADPRKDKTDALLEAFGRHVESLSGRYITAEDVGISASDMDIVSRTTRFARGTDTTGHGDPSPYTARGVFRGIQASVRAAFSRTDLTGMTFAVQGLGSVGYRVAEHLHKAGGRLVVADIHDKAVERARKALDAETVAVDSIHATACDVFVPCALGAVLNAKTIPEIRAAAIAGAANNQLATDRDGVRLRDRNILYAPDYVINAGGVISIGIAEPGNDDARVLERVDAIGETLDHIFAAAKESSDPTAIVADRLAEEILQKAR